jgi:hypothetical protein
MLSSLFNSQAFNVCLVSAGGGQFQFLETLKYLETMRKLNYVSQFVCHQILIHMMKELTELFSHSENCRLTMASA